MESLNFGELLQMEGRPDADLALQLDMQSGIDAWELLRGGGMRGVAARVQESPKSWKSFTVRMERSNGAKTEYAKRWDAINGGHGLIYPHLTVQAYAQTKDGPIIEVGVCRTSDLIQFIDDGNHHVRKTTNATFAACYWRDMANQGIDVETVTPTEPRNNKTELSATR